MKSRWKTYSVTQLDKHAVEVANQELRKYRDKIYEDVEWDVFQQALACCFIALEHMGWRKKRLTDFKNAIDDVTHMMYTGIMGREVTTLDALKHLKEAYGIDFSESKYKAEYDRDAATDKEENRMDSISKTGHEINSAEIVKYCEKILEIVQRSYNTDTPVQLSEAVLVRGYCGFIEKEVTLSGGKSG